MLRCTHATASRAQFKYGMALRTSLNSPWTKSSRRLIPRLGNPYSLFTGRILASSRAYHTRLGFPTTESQDADIPFEKPGFTARSIRVRKLPPARRDSRPDPLQDMLLKVASNSDAGARKTSKVVQLELTWLQDEILIAKRVERLLQQDKVALAADILRAALADKMKCAAGWNKIIEYCLHHNNVPAAFKFWNDMKKRGLRPTARGYTMMLSGLGQVTKTPKVHPVRVARSIYESLKSETSLVELSIVHVNAMLNVCSKHGDMDTLWAIAGDLPEEGPLSPDRITYTIILNAIRHSILREVDELEFKQNASYQVEVYQRRLSGVTEAKRIWADVVYRWKNGTIQLESDLIGAMVGVLKEGNGAQHLYEVFQLIHQTTGLPVHERKPLPDRPPASYPSDKVQENVPFLDEQDTPMSALETTPETTEIVEEESDEENFEKLFDPVVSADMQSDTAIPSVRCTPSYVPLDNKVLTFIMDTCLLMNHSITVAKSYWGDITRSHMVDPDERAFLAYLRVLRVSRNSRVVVDLFRDQMVPAGKAGGSAFRIALSTCKRDRKNPNVLKHANELMSLMNAALAVPDVRAVESYNDLIDQLAQNPQSLLASSRVKNTGLPRNMEAHGRSLLFDLKITALDHLRPLVAKLEEALVKAKSRPPDSESSKFPPAKGQTGHEALTQLTRVRALMDSVLKAENHRYYKAGALKALEEESKALRKYSNADVISKYHGLAISPPRPRSIYAKEKEHRPIPFSLDPSVSG
ncbi:hypothetical protein BJX99DRAFT_230910 [Aspergillus californicus]